MFRIIWTNKSLEQLDNQEPLISLRICKKIEELRDNPFPKVKRLKGDDVFSLRVGDYRIILDINVKENKIYVLRIGHRKNIYKRG